MENYIACIFDRELGLWRMTSAYSEITDLPDDRVLMVQDLAGAEAELNARYPAVPPFARVFKGVYQRAVSEAEVPALMVTERPILTDVLDPEQLKSCCAGGAAVWCLASAYDRLRPKLHGHKAFFVSRSGYHKVGPVRDREFAQRVYRYLTCMQGDLVLEVRSITYNPMRIKRAEYDRRLNAYNNLMRGDFSYDALSELEKCFDPHKWGGQYPRCLKLRNEGRYTGDVRELVKAAKWLAPGHPWRRVAGKSPNFRRVLKQLLPYLHGVEQKAKENRCYPHETTRKIARFNGWLCKWIRDECKAMKISIPGPPVRPVMPRQPRQVRGKSVKVRALSVCPS